MESSPSILPTDSLLTINAVTYGHTESQLRCFIESVKLQSDARWHLNIWHDGPAPIMSDDNNFDLSAARTQKCLFEYRDDPRVQIIFVDKRYNDWGHSLRELSIQATGTKYWNTQNCDNYLCPRFVEMFLYKMETEDLAFAWCNMVHNYAGAAFGLPPYCMLDSQPRQDHIDVANWVIRTDVLRDLGFPFRSRGADGEFIEYMMRRMPTIAKGKLDSLLLVHN